MAVLTTGDLGAEDDALDHAAHPLENARADLLQAGLDVLVEAGAEISSTNTGIRVARNGAGIAPVPPSLREVTSEYGVPLILDEIQAGCGRTTLEAATSCSLPCWSASSPACWPRSMPWTTPESSGLRMRSGQRYRIRSTSNLAGDSR